MEIDNAADRLAAVVAGMPSGPSRLRFEEVLSRLRESVSPADGPAADPDYGDHPLLGKPHTALVEPLDETDLDETDLVDTGLEDTDPDEADGDGELGDGVEDEDAAEGELPSALLDDETTDDDETADDDETGDDDLEDAGPDDLSLDDGGLDDADLDDGGLDDADLQDGELGRGGADGAGPLVGSPDAEDDTDVEDVLEELDSDELEETATSAAGDDAGPWDGDGADRWPSDATVSMDPVTEQTADPRPVVRPRPSPVPLPLPEKRGWFRRRS